MSLGISIRLNNLAALAIAALSQTISQYPTFQKKKNNNNNNLFPHYNY